MCSLWFNGDGLGELNYFIARSVTSFQPRPHHTHIDRQFHQHIDYTAQYRRNELPDDKNVLDCSVAYITVTDSSTAVMADKHTKGHLVSYMYTG